MSPEVWAAVAAAVAAVVGVPVTIALGRRGRVKLDVRAQRDPTGHVVAIVHNPGKRNVDVLGVTVVRHGTTTEVATRSTFPAPKAPLPSDASERFHFDVPAQVGRVQVRVDTARKTYRCEPVAVSGIIVNP